MSNYITPIILAIMLFVAAYLGSQARKIYDKVANTEIKRTLVKDAVLFVEQVYRDIHGEDKLHAAMARASELFAEYGITVTETELVTMIESAVKEFINSFNKE